MFTPCPIASSVRTVRCYSCAASPPAHVRGRPGGRLTPSAAARRARFQSPAQTLTISCTAVTHARSGGPCECVVRMRELGSHSRTSGGNSSDWSGA